MQKTLSFFIAGCLSLQVTAQSIPMAVYILPFVPAQKVSVLKGYRMDSTYSLIGIQPGLNAVAGGTEIKFLVNNDSELQKIKKNWKVFQRVTSDYDSTVIQLFLIKNKQVVTTWNVFPRAHAIIMNDGMFQFNPDRLQALADRYPLQYRKQIDTFYAIAALKRFNDSITASPNFIFNEPTHFSFDGGFSVQPAQENVMDAASLEQELARVCKKNLSRDSYSIFKRTDAEGKEGIPVYVIKCSAQDYEKFPGAAFRKGEWRPEPQLLVSYWKIN